ncbi:MAG: monovalent cation/H(+) antiporter subunit G [Gemmatimonadota bacterium]|nr:monovalent cation/H(+) antiporter subunit G [Gemmatimonadota bacterium]
MLILSLEIFCIAAGVFFMFVSSLGLIRLPDFYSRLHAPTKAATLGLFFLLIAVALAVPEAVMVTKALLVVAFIAATAPVGAHILARAAYRNDVPRSDETELDEYAPVVQRRRKRVAEPTHASDLEHDPSEAR